MNPKNQVTESFTRLFGGDKPERFFFSPGRVNLIGEHTDYNGGYVFPCALDFGTYGAARKRSDNKIRFASGNIDRVCEVDINNLEYNPDHGWANYLKGVAAEIHGTVKPIGGFDLCIWGNIPNGAGLSSSASIELLTSVAVSTMFDCGISMKDMVLLSQRVENNYVGVNCGIMDQYAVGFGKKNHALLLDCNAVEHEYVPLDLGDNLIVVANTNKQRGLADSKYNERRSECDEAVRLLQKECIIKTLCELDNAGFDRHKHLISDPVILNRAAHAVYENSRTKKAVEVLSGGDIKSFGKMMNDSHISLRDLYEVTGAELDALAEAAWAADGVLGSRMTGAGFGGCTVSILRKDAADNFIKTVGDEYKKRTGLTADFYMAQTGDGACEIQ